MSCGVNIPLSDIVEALIDNYADVITGHIANGLDLSKYVTVEGGSASNITLRDGVTLDQATTAALCGYLQDCVADKLEQFRTDNPDNYVQEFSIDDTNNLLVIRMSGGEKYSVSREELRAWLGVGAGGATIAGGVRDGALQGNTLRLNNTDGTTADIDLSSLNLPTTPSTDNDTKVTGAELQQNNLVIELSDGTNVTADLGSLTPTIPDTKLQSGTLDGATLKLTLADGNTVDVDLSGLRGNAVDTNTYPVSGSFTPPDIIRIELNNGDHFDIDLHGIHTPDNDTFPTELTLEGNNLKLSLNNGSVINTDLASLSVGKDSPYITSGVLAERDGGYWLDFTRSDTTQVNVDMSQIISTLRDKVVEETLKVGYTLKTENNHYTTQAEDFNGFTIIRANRNGDQTITLTKPDDSFVGKALIVRKTNGDVGTFVTLKAGDDVTISPEDSTPLRRVGSSATLVYTGEGNWDVFGELP